MQALALLTGHSATIRRARGAAEDTAFTDAILPSHSCVLPGMGAAILNSDVRFTCDRSSESDLFDEQDELVQKPLWAATPKSTVASFT